LASFPVWLLGLVDNEAVKSPLFPPFLRQGAATLNLFFPVFLCLIRTLSLLSFFNLTVLQVLLRDIFSFFSEYCHLGVLFFLFSDPLSLPPHQEVQLALAIFLWRFLSFSAGSVARCLCVKYFSQTAAPLATLRAHDDPMPKSHPQSILSPGICPN